MIRGPVIVEAGEFFVKDARVATWSDVEERESALVQRCASGDEAACAEIVADRLQRALDRLPFDQRTVVILREIDGLSYEEIAYSLGTAVGTVKSRLTRGRRALREELREARIA